TSTTDCLSDRSVSVVRIHPFPYTTLFRSLEIIAIAMSLLFVLWTKQAIDIATSSWTADLKTALILVVASLLLTLILRSISSWISERTRIRMGLSLQRQMIEEQMMSAWKTVKNWHSGDIQVSINSACNEVVAMLAYSAI